MTESINDNSQQIGQFTQSINMMVESAVTRMNIAANEDFLKYTKNKNLFNICAKDSPSSQSFRQHYLENWDTLLYKASLIAPQNYKDTREKWSSDFIKAIKTILDSEKEPDDIVFACLSDSKSINNFGFTLRRMIIKHLSQEQRAELIKKNIDIQTTENSDWDEATTEAFLASLFIFYDKKKIPPTAKFRSIIIPKESWITYLMNIRIPEASTVYRMALILGLSIDELVPLLNAADIDINYRDPEQLIYYYFLNNSYSLEEAEKVINNWENKLKTDMSDINTENSTCKDSFSLLRLYLNGARQLSTPKVGETINIQNKMNEIENSSKPDRQQEDMLYNFIFKNSSLIPFSGFSLSKRMLVLYFLKFVSFVYPLDNELSPPKTYDENGYPKLAYLFKSIECVVNGWGYAKKFYPELEKIEKQLGTIKREGNITKRNALTTEKPIPVTRKLVLSLFTYFTFGFLSYSERTGNVLTATLIKEATILKPTNSTESAFFETMTTDVYNRLNDIRNSKRSCGERLSDLRIAINSILLCFDFDPIYLPNQFDRAIILNILTKK